MQQVPSVQSPDTHCDGSLQAEPLGCGVGVDVGIGVGDDVGVFVGRGTHVPNEPGTPQDCPAGQPEVEQQYPSTQAPSGALAVARHCAGSVHGLPTGSGGLHVPSSPGMLQNSLAGHTSVLQHTPSVQKPLLHSWPLTHCVPNPTSEADVQTPVLQTWPGAQGVGQQNPALSPEAITHCAEAHW